MSNDELRWTRYNVGKPERDNKTYIQNLKYCDNYLVNLSKYREYAIHRWTTKRNKKRSTILSLQTAIKSCHHRPLLSATRNFYSLLNLKIVTFVCILNYLNSLTCATAAVIDTVDFSKGDHYTHTWAVHIPNGDDSGKADQVAEDHGFVNLGKVSTFVYRCLKLCSDCCWSITFTIYIQITIVKWYSYYALSVVAKIIAF